MMQRSKKGLSTVVGAIFLVAIIFAGIGVINWGVGLQDNYALTISERNQIDWERLNEKVELTDLSIDNNKFNITLQNAGTLPARLVRLWVTNETSPWHQKYDTNYLLNPTTKLTNLGQSLGLNALSTQDYVIGVVTERGNLATFRAASPSNQALKLNLYALPSTVTSKFQTTLMLSVNNNLTNVDVIPKVTPITDLQVSAPAGATYTKISGPTPVSDNGLLSGETTFFKWIYEVNGSDNQVITFTASLVGGKPGNSASANVTIKKVETSKNAEMLLTNSGTLLMNFTSFQFCKPVIADCRSNSPAWAAGWQVQSGNTEYYLWRVNVTNNGSKDIFLDSRSAILLLHVQSGAGGNMPTAMYIKADSTTTNEDPGAYVNYSKNLKADANFYQIYFGVTTAGGASLQSIPAAGLYAVNIVLFGFSDANGNHIYESATDTAPYSQNLPFQGLNAT